MEAFLISTAIVTLAEIGDKTQLLAFVLAARFRRPLPIILGILLATLANHGLAALAGTWLIALVSPQALRWILGLSFLGIAIWTLIPDRLESGEEGRGTLGVFGATLVAFFSAEMADKTQVATIALAARYDAFLSVVSGTTLGMMFANVPAVLIGHRLANRLPVVPVQRVAALLFALLGLATLLWGPGGA